MRLIQLLTLCFLASSFIGCPWTGGRGAIIDSQSRIQRALIEEERDRRSGLTGGVPASSDAQYAFLLGELALNDERPKVALSYYEKAAKIETGVENS